MSIVDKTVVKSAIDKATAEFTDRISSMGFKRTKKWFWVRESEISADFIHLHLDGISYGAPISYSVSFRAHTGYRHYSDDFEALALNGPCSSDANLREKRYHHRFNAKSGSTYDRCLDDLVRFTKEVSEPWLNKQNSSSQVSEEFKNKSLKLLGIKRAK